MHGGACVEAGPLIADAPAHSKVSLFIRPPVTAGFA